MGLWEGEGREYRYQWRCTVLWETGAAHSIWPWWMMSQDLFCWRTLMEWSVADNPEQPTSVALQQFCTRVACRLGNHCSTEWLYIFALKCNVHQNKEQNQAQSEVMNKSCIQSVSKDWVAVSQCYTYPWAWQSGQSPGSYCWASAQSTCLWVKWGEILPTAPCMTFRRRPSLSVWGE